METSRGRVIGEIELEGRKMQVTMKKRRPLLKLKRLGYKSICRKQTDSLNDVTVMSVQVRIQT